MKTASISERAILVHVGCHGTSFRQMNKKYSQKVCKDANAENDVANVWMRKSPKKEIKPIETAMGRLKALHQKYTMPWLVGGYGIMPADMYMEFMSKARKLIDDVDKVVAEFKAHYPELIERQKAEKRLGDLIEGARFPSVAELDSIFRVTIDVVPVPETADFRVQMADEQLAKVLKEAQRTEQEIVKRALSKVWETLGDLVGSVVESTSTADRRIYTNVIKNLKDYCIKIPKFNIVDDKELDDIRAEVMDKLAELDVEDLKEIPNKRKAANKEAKEILDKINAYFGSAA